MHYRSKCFGMIMFICFSRVFRGRGGAYAGGFPSGGGFAHSKTPYLGVGTYIGSIAPSFNNDPVMIADSNSSSKL